MNDDVSGESEFARQLRPHLLRGIEEMDAARAAAAARFTKANADEVRRQTRELTAALKGERDDDAS